MMKTSLIHSQPSIILLIACLFWISSAEFADAAGIKPEPSGQATEQKKDLKPEDYAQWQRISTAQLSPNADWFSWTIHLVEGDGWLMLQQTGEDPDDGKKFEHALRPGFSADNRWFAFLIGVSEEERRQMSDQNERIKYQLALKDLSSAEIDTFNNISTYEFSEDGRILLMRKYRPENSEIRGYDLILRNLEAGTNQLIGNVAEYELNEEGTKLAYLIDSHDQIGNGVHLINLETMSTRVLESDEAEYEKLIWHWQDDPLQSRQRVMQQHLDEWVLLYDEFDVYKASPDGSRIERITDGREHKIRYRQQRLDFETTEINPEDPFYLNKFGERTKDRGYARVNLNGEVETLIYESAAISNLVKAEDVPRYIYQRQTAVNSPNYYLTDAEFGSPVALTNTNPQQEDFYWAEDELIHFTNKRGEELEGRLLYPANYDPGQQYPMIVLIYERMSQTLHNYSLPSRTSAYNQRRFSSEGYFVFMPDITYELNRPGMSAVESVVPAVETVLETGMVDPGKIGLTGHSWGGYHTNFIITQTDLFSSAVAGAPLVNLISMYNSIYWSSGFHQGYIFETSQGRFPYPWWEDKEYFLENSPLHQIENSETPLMLMFGTDDGAVPFNQGVELYTTMRRMHKEFVMLVYEGEGHGLGRRENQIDYANRAMEWHAHYLLGKEPAPWIVEGIPFIERPELQER
ncbi:MAG: S9 family peptidase [Balneolaceae bacterium]|nr:S9 family peptidase [Balneolaceae bacterium]